MPARLSGHSAIGSTHLSGQGNACHVCSATASQRNSVVLFAVNAPNNTQRLQIIFFKKHYFWKMNKNFTDENYVVHYSDFIFIATDSGIMQNSKTLKKYIRAGIRWKNHVKQDWYIFFKLIVLLHFSITCRSKKNIWIMDRRPLDLQSNSLPLSYIPLFYTCERFSISS